MFMDEDILKPEHDQMLLWLDDNIESLINSVIYPNMTTEQIADFLETEPDIKRTWQQPIKSATGQIVGFVDMVVSYDRVDAAEHISKVFFLDVRAEIPSLGALIREINTYKLYLGFEDSWIYSYVVIGPDDRYANILQAQGITSWPYPVGAKEAK